MCARITQQLSPNQIGELHGVRATPLPPDRKPRYNGAPRQDFSACIHVMKTTLPAAIQIGLVFGFTRVMSIARSHTGGCLAALEKATRPRPRQLAGLRGPPTPIASAPAKKVAPGDRWRRFQIEGGPPHPWIRSLETSSGCDRIGQ